MKQTENPVKIKALAPAGIGGVVGKRAQLRVNGKRTRFYKGTTAREMINLFFNLNPIQF